MLQLKRRSKGKLFTLELLVILGILVVNVWIGGWSVQYVVDFWGTYIQHKQVQVPMMPCCIAGLFLAEISIPAAVVTWILSFIL